MIEIKVGEKIRYVDNVHLTSSKGGGIYGMVNNGHDDLYDLGFKVDEILEHGIEIKTVENIEKLNGGFLLNEEGVVIGYVDEKTKKE